MAEAYAAHADRAYCHSRLAPTTFPSSLFLPLTLGRDRGTLDRGGGTYLGALDLGPLYSGPLGGEVMLEAYAMVSAGGNGRVRATTDFVTTYESSGDDDDDG